MGSPGTAAELELKLATTSQTSEILGGLDEDTVRGLVRNGDLQAVRIPSRPGVEARKLRIVVSSIDRYVDRLAGEQAGVEV